MAEHDHPAEQPETTKTIGGAEGDSVLEAAILDSEALMAGAGEEDEPDARASGPRRGKRSDDPEDDEPEEPEEEDEEELRASDEEPDDDDEEEEPDEEDQEQTEDEEDDELYDAIVALRATGVPASVLKSTSRTKLIAWARRVEASKTPPAESPQAEREDETEAAPAQGEFPSWESYSETASRMLGVDEDVIEAVLKPIYDATARLHTDNQELRRQRQEEASSARAREGRAVIDSQIQRLGAKYPELLRDEKLREAVIDEAATVVSGLRARGKDVDATSVFDRAARSVRGKPKRSDMGQLRRNGHSEAPASRVSDRHSPASEDDYFERAIDLAERGQGHRIRQLRPPEKVVRRANTRTR